MIMCVYAYPSKIHDTYMHVYIYIQVPAEEVKFPGVRDSTDCSLTVYDLSPPLAAGSDTTPEGQQPQPDIEDDTKSQPPSVNWEELSAVSSPRSPPGEPLNVTSRLKLSEAAEKASVALRTSCGLMSLAGEQDIAQLYVTTSIPNI